MKNKVITIFGSSFPKPGDNEYEFAYELGKKLGEKNFTICNGGFYGIMEATAKGAVHAGAHTIGVTVGLWNLSANPFIKEEIPCKTLFERVEKLINLADAFIILKGGTGTLLELASILEFFNKNLLNSRPIVADKEYWSSIINLMNKRNEYEGRKKVQVLLSDNINEIIGYLEEKLEK